MNVFDLVTFSLFTSLLTVAIDTSLQFYLHRRIMNALKKEKEKEQR